MAFRGLLFSSSQETGTALTRACSAAGISLEVCSDIFLAIEKGTRHPFSVVVADWANQPEAPFLLRRARESSPNKNLVVIAVVDRELTPAEMRDHHLEFLIYRPIAAAQAQEVLAKVAEKMRPVAAEAVTETPLAEPADDKSLSTVPTGSPEQTQDSGQPSEGAPAEAPSAENAGAPESTIDTSVDTPGPSPSAFSFRRAAAAALLLAAAFCLWRARATITYLARTHEGRSAVLKESVAAFVDLAAPVAAPTRFASQEAQQDTSFSRSASASSAQSQRIAVVATAPELSDSRSRLRKPADFPLPAPVYETPRPVPVPMRHGAVPESLRNAAPITRPVVVTVNPALMTPVSMPAVSPLPQQFSEPIVLSEEAARALLVHGVNPIYPPNAAAQKLHGPVVLQATIGRDGSVEDLKIVRGSFALAKAAIAAVKQWRFQPYTINGRPAQTQTLITINFVIPPG